LAGNCFTDHRRRSMTRHEIRSMLTQMVYSVALGYEDVNDHDQLSMDKLVGLACGAKDLSVDTPLASSSTLCRLQHGEEGKAAVHRECKISSDIRPMEKLLLDICFKSYGGRVPHEAGIHAQSISQFLPPTLVNQPN